MTEMFGYIGCALSVLQADRGALSINILVLYSLNNISQHFWTFVYRLSK